MRRFQLSLVCLIGIVPFGSIYGDEAAELQAIIDKAVQAAGGIEVLEKYQNQTGKEEGTFHGGGQTFPFTANFTSAAPDKFRLEVEGVFTLVLDGDKGWINSGGATQEMDPQQLKEQQEEQYIGWVMSLVPLAKEKDKFKLSKIGGETIDGRETLGMKVEQEGRREISLFFDKETYDMIQGKYAVKVAEAGFAEADQALIFKNFQKVGDARMATEVLILRDGDKYVEAKLSDVKPVEEFPADTFARP